jgi:hypothetical protein
MWTVPDGNRFYSLFAVMCHKSLLANGLRRYCASGFVPRHRRSASGNAQILASVDADYSPFVDVTDVRNFGGNQVCEGPGKPVSSLPRTAGFERHGSHQRMDGISVAFL